VLASLGKLSEAPATFDQPCESVTRGGVLFALPALMACGLLRHSSRFFMLPKGYYGLETIFLLMSFLALCRIRKVENLRYSAPGEWGKLLGLDRCPEVKTLREKISLISQGGNAPAWSAELCKDWMEADPDNTGTLYVDGHCRVYHGEQTQLPRHYIARQRLCLRATTDYWVHGLDGLPFFKINQAVDPGLIQSIEEKILPQLQAQVPNQPTEEQLKENKLRQRFRLIFDREGYSPAFFKRMQAKRIATQTYLKNVKADWPPSEFSPHQVRLMAGNTAPMDLAERGTLIGTGADQLWVREIRKLTQSGHQIAIVSTDWLATPEQIVAPQFGRWYQENYFKYAREHFDLDGLIDYQLEPVDGTTRITNPAWRQLDGAIRKRTGENNRTKVKLQNLQLQGQATPEKAQAYQDQATQLQEQLKIALAEAETLKKQRRNEPKHITVEELPEGERFQKLATRSKHFVDTIKILAYRAETALAATIKDRLNEHHQDEARAMIRDICQAEADLYPDLATKTLTVKLHSLASPRQNAAAAHLCAELNATETKYPGTDLRLIFKTVSD
jgi:hypothetical protein